MNPTPSLIQHSTFRIQHSITAFLILTSIAGSTLTAQPPFQGPPRPVDPNDPNVILLQKLGKRPIRVHDPSTIVQCKDRYWLFCTGRSTPSYYSKDLVTWERGPATFKTSPEWVA